MSAHWHCRGVGAVTRSKLCLTAHMADPQGQAAQDGASEAGQTPTSLRQNHEADKDAQHSTLDDHAHQKRSTGVSSWPCGGASSSAATACTVSVAVWRS